MLKNYINQDETINRIYFPKNNFFCYRWRVKDHFSRSIERQQYNMKVLGGGQDHTLMNNKILALYKARYHSTKSDMIAELAKKTMVFLDERRAIQKKVSEKEILLSGGARELLQRCYNTLSAFATEMNSLLGLSELFITSTEPVVTNKVNGKPTVDSVMLARLSTSSFSLFMEGSKSRVEFYILPAEELLALADLVRNHAPIASLKARVDSRSGKVMWLLDNDSDTILDDNDIDECCVELLNALLEATKERIAPSIDEPDENRETFSLFDPEPWYMEAMHRHHAQKDQSKSRQTMDYEAELESRPYRSPAQESRQEHGVKKTFNEINAQEFVYDERKKRWVCTDNYSASQNSAPQIPAPHIPAPHTMVQHNPILPPPMMEQHDDECSGLSDISAKELALRDFEKSDYLLHNDDGLFKLENDNNEIAENRHEANESSASAKSVSCTQVGAGPGFSTISISNVIQDSIIPPKQSAKIQAAKIPAKRSSKRKRNRRKK